MYPVIYILTPRVAALGWRYSFRLPFAEDLNWFRTVAVVFEEAAEVALVADGFARRMRNRDIPFDRTISPVTWKSSDVNTYDNSFYKEDSVYPNLPANPDDL